MSENNGDRPTGKPPPTSDWRSPAFDIAEVPEPYRVRILQSALQELDESIRSAEGIIEVRIRAWEKSIDRRIAAAVHQAAEEAVSRVEGRIIRELGKVSHRLDAVENSAELAASRAEKAAEASGQWKAVTLNVNTTKDSTDPPSSSELAPPGLPRLSKLQKMKKPSAIVGVIVAIVATIVNAWLAGKR